MLSVCGVGWWSIHRLVLAPSEPGRVGLWLVLNQPGECAETCHFQDFPEAIVRRFFLPLLVVTFLCLSGAGICQGRSDEAPTTVTTLRVPNRGIQPQVVVDPRGQVHLLYFKGAPAGGDLYYVRSKDGGRTFSEPLSV